MNSAIDNLSIVNPETLMTKFLNICAPKSHGSIAPILNYVNSRKSKSLNASWSNPFGCIGHDFSLTPKFTEISNPFVL